MRKLMVAAVAVLGMTVGYPRAEAKDTQPAGSSTAQSKQGPTEAEVDEAYRMNKEYDAARAKAQSKQGPTEAEVDEAYRMNKEYDAARAAASPGAKTQEVQGKVESVSGDSLTLRLPSKLNRKLDRLKANAQSKIVKDSRPATLSELKEGDEVRVSYKVVGSERHLVTVEATSTGTPAPAKKTP